MQLEKITQWLETLPTWARPIVEVAAIVVVSAVVTLIVCVIGGWTTLINISNALFLASAVVFLIGMLIYFGSKAEGSIRSRQEQDKSEKSEPETALDVLRRRRRPGSRYTTIFIVAGFLVFGLSVAVGSFV